MFVSTSLTKGIVKLSEFSGVGSFAPPRPEYQQAPTFRLRYESMMEMDTDHGMSTICDILVDAGLWILLPEQRKHLTAEIRAKVPRSIWPMVRDLLRPTPGHKGWGDNCDPYVVALWAELFAEPLSDVWLAAMAHHAFVERNDFAFGYLTAQLDSRRDTERDYVRGRKSVESGRAGAEIRAGQVRQGTSKTLQEMQRLISGGHSVSRAAEIAAGSGVGRSADANRKLWARHRIK